MTWEENRLKISEPGGEYWITDPFNYPLGYEDSLKYEGNASLEIRVAVDKGVVRVAHMQAAIRLLEMALQRFKA